MREVKFRAWDKDELVMFQPEDIRHINFTEKMIILNTNDYDFIGDFGDDEDGTLILMQYTGLKDKNGKEIFEGDILYHNEYYWLVKYGEYEYHTFGDTDVISYGLIFENYNFGETDNFNSDWIVIGNIYENPELLEENNYES